MNTTSSNPTDKADKTEFWDQHRGTIYSHVGGSRMGEGVVFSRGHNILNDIMGKASYFQLMILNATGRLPDLRLSQWVEAAFMCVSFPELRIWCNMIGAFGGTLETSAVASTAAGMLAADSTMYGSRPLIEGAEFIQQALKENKEGSSVADIVERQCARYRGKPHIVGYARPIASGDQRIVAMEQVTKQLGFEIGEHLELAYEIQNILSERFLETMNVNGYCSAFLSDQGYTAEEIYRLSVNCVNSGVTASYINAKDRLPESFLPLRCEDIDYYGTAPRSVPERDP